MTKFTTAAIALAMLCCACSNETVEPTETTQTQTVRLDISTDSWGDMTRAGGELLTPVTLLLVQDGGTTVVKRNVVTGTDFSIEVPNGEYEIFAVCGLPEGIVPDDLFDEIEVPLSGIGGGMTDFAVGSAKITNAYGKLSSPSASITAKRQMAWLTVTVSDLPEYFTETALYVKGLGETYNLADGWTTSEEGKAAFTNCNIVKKAGKNIASVDKVTIPCTDKNHGTEFKVVGKTNDNKTVTYRYTSPTPMVAGKHFTRNFSMSDLIPVSEAIDIPDWDDDTESATLSNPTVED